MTRAPLSLAEALLPVAALVALLITGAATTGLTGEMLVAALLAAAACAAWIAHRHGATWSDVERVTGVRIGGVLPALLILLAIGMLIATWVLSGTIPFLVYWGVRLVRPEHLLLTAFLATAAMSLGTGTSWGSAGTIGVALIGVATALGAPLGATAGAVVAGAYFGDKVSPLSDSTNICAIAADVPLYRHIRYLLWTAVPSFVLSVVVFAVAGRMLGLGGTLPDSARALTTELDAAFSLHWITLLPLAVVVIGILRRVPPVLAIAASAAVAAVLGVLLQGVSPDAAITAAVAGFTPGMLGDDVAYSDAFIRLVQRGGLYSMATTLIVILAAFLLAAGMEASGALDLIIARMLAAVRSAFGLIASTMAAGATMIALTSHGGVTSLVIGGLFQNAYRERGLAPENLSRSLEDSVTITEPLMPWTVSAVFMATTLGVPTTQYAPWAVFCYSGFVGSLVLARGGRLKAQRLEGSEESRASSEPASLRASEPGAA